MKKLFLKAFSSTILTLLICACIVIGSYNISHAVESYILKNNVEVQMCYKYNTPRFYQSTEFNTEWRRNWALPNQYQWIKNDYQFKDFLLFIECGRGWIIKQSKDHIEFFTTNEFSGTPKTEIINLWGGVVTVYPL